MRIGYFVKKHGETIDDVIYFKETVWVDGGETDKRALVKDACEYAWHNEYGWEWIPAGPVITLVVDGVEQGDYPVDVAPVPVFSVGRRVPDAGS